jgi:hypothetical protein
MVNVYVRLPAQALESTARIRKVEVPTAVGVPERTPRGDRVRPGGSDPDVTEKLKGATPPSPWIVL